MGGSRILSGNRRGFDVGVARGGGGVCQAEVMLDCGLQYCLYKVVCHEIASMQRFVLVVLQPWRST